jgi:uncharacterized protein YciI
MPDFLRPEHVFWQLSENQMKKVVFFHIAIGGLKRIERYRAAHMANLREFQARGLLLLAGDFKNPSEGVICVFKTRTAAEEFIARDPFVNGGVVDKWTVLRWDETLCRQLAKRLMAGFRADPMHIGA